MTRLLLILAALLPQDDEAAFRKRIAARKAESRQRIEDARRKIAAEDKASTAAAEALRARLAKKPLALALRSGEKIARALIRAASHLEIQFDGRTLPWSDLDPASVAAAAAAVWDSPADRGRVFAAQRMWKEAREAFKDQRDVAALIDRILTGQGSFGGKVQRHGPTSLTLSYDFKSNDQLRDFGEDITWSAKGGVIDAKEETYVYLAGLQFSGDLDVDIAVTSTAAFWVSVLGDTWIHVTRDGVKLERWVEGQDPKEIASSDKARLAKRHELKITLRGRTVKLVVDGKEALLADAPTAPHGDFGFGIDEGMLVVSSLSVRGSCDQRGLDKKFAEAEVHARRAIDPELRAIAAARAKDRPPLGPLTADDPYLAKGAPLLEHVRSEVPGAGDDPGAAKTLVKMLDKAIESHPAAPAPYYLRALIRYQVDEIEAAQADVKKALALFPDFAEAHVLQAQIHDWDQDWDLAAAAAQRAIDAFPDTAAAWTARALASYGRDAAATALDDARLAVALAPGDADAATALRAIRLQSRGPREVGCRFVHDSPHYTVMTDISDEAARAYAQRLEAAYEHFADQFKHVYKPPASFRKPRVTVFNTGESFFTWSELVSEEREEEDLGHFTDRWNELVLYEAVDMSETLDTLYHESFHHFTTLMARHTLPYWFNEGIAEYMAGIVVKDGRVAESGRVSPTRLPDIQHAIADDRAVPWDQLMIETPAQFYGENSDLKYAQAWSMVHFLRHAAKEKHRPLLDRYFDELRARKPARDSFNAVFKENWETLQAEWKEYVKTLK